MTSAPEPTQERLEQILEMYRTLGLDPGPVPSVTIVEQPVPKLVVIPMLSNNSNFG